MPLPVVFPLAAARPQFLDFVSGKAVGFSHFAEINVNRNVDAIGGGIAEDEQERVAPMAKPKSPCERAFTRRNKPIYQPFCVMRVWKRD